MNKWCFCALLVLAQAGIEYLPNKITLEWSFPSEETVEFAFNIPSEIITSWSWAGFGLRNHDSKDIKPGHLDLITVQWDPYSIDDRWGIGYDSYPKPDTAWDGGSNDVEGSYEHTEDNSRVYTIRRKLDTNDEWDFPLSKDESYSVIWAFGQTYQGKPIGHNENNRGSEYLILSEGYVDDDSDDTALETDLVWVQDDSIAAMDKLFSGGRIES